VQNTTAVATQTPQKVKKNDGTSLGHWKNPQKKTMASLAPLRSSLADVAPPLAPLARLRWRGPTDAALRSGESNRRVSRLTEAKEGGEDTVQRSLTTAGFNETRHRPQEHDRMQHYLRRL
jgi:hypothetical protein